MNINSFILVLRNAFQGLSTEIIVFLPKLILGIVLAGIGWVTASSFEKVLVYLGEASRADELLAKTGLRETLAKFRVRLDSGAFLGFIVKWFIFLAFLFAGMEAAGFAKVNTFLYSLAFGELPKIVAVLAGLFFTVFVARIAAAAVSSFSRFFLNETVSRRFGLIAFVGVWFAALSALISDSWLAGEPGKILFIAFAAGSAIAFGISFGFALKDGAARFVEKIRD